MIINNLIVSLTSYPQRIDCVHNTIESILKQSYIPEKIILWLADEEFPEKEKTLPKKLLNLINECFSIDWYHNIKSYKKLIPVLKKYPDFTIIIADDDIYYPEKWVELLYKSYLSKPNMVHCHRMCRIYFNIKKEIMSYETWFDGSFLTTPSFNNFPTGGGGILFPKNIVLHQDIFREELFMKLCPTGDDIWFWGMMVLSNLKINLVKKNIKDIVERHTIKSTQHYTLYQINKIQNDIQIANLLSYYPEIYEKLSKKSFFFPRVLSKIMLFYSRALRKKTYIDIIQKVTFSKKNENKE
jgi:hypothetical protein